MRDETPQKISLPLYYLLNRMNRLIWHIRDERLFVFWMNSRQPCGLLLEHIYGHFKEHEE